VPRKGDVVTGQILVPLDGSPLAEQALAGAMMLGRKLPAELVLLRAVSIAPDFRETLSDVGLEAAAIMEKLEAEANDYLREVEDQLRGADLRARRVVRHGPAAEVIVNYATQTGVQQIVMATHGHTGMTRWAHGSVAERVLQSAGVPVLLVRAQEGEFTRSRELRELQRILVPLDGSTTAEQVLPAATLIAKAMCAEMALLRVSIVYLLGSFVGEWLEPLQGSFKTANQCAKDYLDHVGGRLEGEGVEVSTTVQMGAVAESIVQYAETQQMDLIAMCTHGRTGVGRWTLGSVADRVLRASSMPILLVRAQ